MSGKPEGFATAPSRPRSPSGLLDLRGVVHCHSFRSHDSKGTIAEIGAACAATGMDFLVMTDHPSPYSVSRGRRGMVGDTLFLVGAELRAPGGTLLAFPLRHYVRRHATLQGYLDDIHAQGGLAFVCHAERFDAWDAVGKPGGIDGVELHNLHAAARRADKLGVIGRTLATPLRHLFALLARPDPDVLARFDAVAGHPIPVVGGNDAHANIRLLGDLGWVIGTYEEVFRVMSTHVLAERLDQPSLVAAIRAGRTYLSIDLWRDGSGFGFWAEDRHGVHEMGATVGTDARLRVRSPAVAEIRLLRAGKLAAHARGRELTVDDPGPGCYRVEVWLEGELWIASGVIEVRA
ncbi:MAG: hypothetical protein KDC87_19300 [Planctomycetes bacterium]|nr:hypothetical protein [Planctomycetota bacterium]MCB9871789.1 hypothetical protein [Planctomycetota bacterium]